MECIDRLYLNLYQPRLQLELGVVGFFKQPHRDARFVSSVLMDPISKGFVMEIHRFIAQAGVPLVDFKPGRRKDDIAKQFLADFDADEGRAVRRPCAGEDGSVPYREAPLLRDRRRVPVDRAAHRDHQPLLRLRGGRRLRPVLHQVLHLLPVQRQGVLQRPRVAKRQAAKAGIGFEALDNGFLSCHDPARLQRVCDRLSAATVDRCVRKWLARLPHPFTAADRRAGYRYDISVLQAEFSLTQVLDRPLAGRVFFEGVIRENLDIGRPDRVSLILDRKILRRGKNVTPGRFRTRVFTEGGTPSLHLEFKHSCVKQYHKQGRALRTETTIHDSRDFGVGKRLCNPPALRGGRLLSQPASARRRTSHPRTLGRRRAVRRRHQPHRHRHRPRRRAAVRRTARANPAPRPGRLPAAAQRFLQRRPARARRRAQRSAPRRHHRRPHDL